MIRLISRKGQEVLSLRCFSTICKSGVLCDSLSLIALTTFGTYSLRFAMQRQVCDSWC